MNFIHPCKKYENALKQKRFSSNSIPRTIWVQELSACCAFTHSTNSVIYHRFFLIKKKELPSPLFLFKVYNWVFKCVCVFCFLNFFLSHFLFRIQVKHSNLSKICRKLLNEFGVVSRSGTLNNTNKQSNNSRALMVGPQ